MLNSFLKGTDYLEELCHNTRGLWALGADMKFVKKITPPDFQAKNFTPSISPNFNSFSDKNTKNE